MDQYKPNYLGKVIPADNESKLTDFVQNKFDAFNDIYETCKNYSEQISDITNISNDDNLTIKVISSPETMEDIKKNNTRSNITVDLDVITAIV